MGTRTYPERTVSSERTRTTKKKVTPPFSHLAVAATLAALSFMVSFPSQVTAETMNTLNTMDDASDMLADFAKYEMEDSTVDLVNAETGAKLSKNSKAAFGDATPFDDADDFDLGIFVDKKDGNFTGGELVNVTVCEFGDPDACVKTTPYPGAPEEYQCGVSDETVPATAFKCVTKTATTDDDGDLSFIEMDLTMNGEDGMVDDNGEDYELLMEAEAEDDESKAESDGDDGDDGDEKRKKTRKLLDGGSKLSTRRKLAQARQTSSRVRPGSRTVRAGGARGFTGGRRTRGRSRRG